MSDVIQTPKMHVKVGVQRFDSTKDAMFSGADIMEEQNFGF